ncbi:MAG: LysR family transcriptional regulator [Vibrio sp.]
MNYDLNLLHLLVVLNEERQTVLAAKRLNLSQPTVSLMLKKLRAQFNDPLFIRDKNHLTPTIKCQQILTSLPSLLDEIGQLYLDHSHPSLESLNDDIRLYFAPPLMATLAAPLTHALLSVAPNLRIECLGWQKDTALCLEQDQYSWGFAYLPLQTNKVLFEQDVGCDEFAFVMRHDHPLTSAQLPELLEYPFCLSIHPVDYGSSQAENIMRKNKIHKLISIKTTDISFLAELMRFGDYVGILPLRQIRQLGTGFKTFPIPQSLNFRQNSRKISLFSHQHNRRNQISHWLVEQASSILAHSSDCK